MSGTIEDARDAVVNAAKALYRDRSDEKLDKLMVLVNSLKQREERVKQEQANRDQYIEASKQGMWRTKDGKLIPFADIEDGHLANILQRMHRKGYIAGGAADHPSFPLLEEEVRRRMANQENVIYAQSIPFGYVKHSVRFDRSTRTWRPRWLYSREVLSTWEEHELAVAQRKQHRVLQAARLREIERYNAQKEDDVKAAMKKLDVTAHARVRMNGGNELKGVTVEMDADEFLSLVGRVKQGPK